MIKQIDIPEDYSDMSEKEHKHIPVMLKEVLDCLNVNHGAVVVDATLGMGGHSQELLNKIGPQGRLIGVDRDSQSLSVAKENLSAYAGQCMFVQDNYRNLEAVLNRLQIKEVDAILLDLGISSFQLDNAQRGFSFRQEGPLDMRMDQESFISAYDLVNSLSEKELSTILKLYGQERWHHRIARFLVRERNHKPIESTTELEQLILKAIPFRSRKEKLHPATRTFQALRIAVNRELEALEKFFEKCMEHLKVGGRICVISFHSLEDKIVKENFRKLAQEKKVRILTKKPLRPTEEEAMYNSRSRSARLRAAERI